MSMNDDALEAIEWDALLDDSGEHILDLERSVPQRDTTHLSPASSAGGGNGPMMPTALATLPSGKRRKQKDPNRARNERRLELMHLRQQAKDLEGRLLTLKRGGSHCARGSAEPSAECVVEAWRGIAEDLARERESTERENIRLRLLVDNHAKIASQLRRIVMPKRPRYARGDAVYMAQDPHLAKTSQPLGTATATGRSKGPRTQRHPCKTGVGSREPLSRTIMDVTRADDASAHLDAEMFHRLLHRVSRARAEIDGIFTANGLAATDKAYRSAKVEQNETSGVSMELVASIELPYDLQTTQRVTWQHFSRTLPHMPDRTFFQYHTKNEDMDLMDPEDTDVVTYSLELANGFVNCKFDEWRAMRRFILPDRVVIIFCLLAETTEFASEPVDGIQVFEQAYIVLRQPDTRSQGIGAVTLMQTCYHVQPVVTKPDAGSERTLAKLTDFLFAFVAGTISVNHQMIERELEATQP